MCRAAFLPWPMPTVTVRSAGTMSPPAKTPAWPVIMSGPTCTTPSSTSSPATPSSRERSASWPSASTSESASAPRTRRSAAGSRSRPAPSARREPALVGAADRREPLHQHALLLGLLDLEVVGGHPVAGAPVDDDRVRRRPAAWRCGPRPSPCCRRRRRRPGGRAAAAPRPPCCAASRPRRACGRPSRRGCTRACRCARRRRGRRHRSRRPASPRGRRPSLSSSSATPRSRMRSISASRTSRGRRYWGMPKRIIPPAPGPASRIVTSWPSRARW